MVYADLVVKLYTNRHLRQGEREIIRKLTAGGEVYAAGFYFKRNILCKKDFSF